MVWGDLRGCLMAVSLAPDEFSVKLVNGTGQEDSAIEEKIGVVHHQLETSKIQA